MKRKYFVSILLIFSFQFSQSANITGKIIDNDTKLPIPLVNIHIKGTSIGTISNNDGEFSIQIPKIYKLHKIVFSYIGYQIHEIAINKIENSTNYIVSLNSVTTKLDEVFISRKKLSATEIVHKAFKKYNINFPTTNFLNKGFFRYKQRSLIEYKWLIEGTFDYYDEGYNNPIENILVDIKELRKSVDGREVDTLSIYFSYLIQHKGLNNKNAYKKSLLWKKAQLSEIQEAILLHDQEYLQNLEDIIKNKIYDPIRNYYNPSSPFFKENFFKKHSFKKDTSLYTEEKLYYKIKILPNRNHRRILKNYGKSLLPIGYLIIDSESFKITELRYDLIFDNKKGKTHRRYAGVNYRNSTTIKYKDVEGKMIPYYLTIKYPVSFMQNFNKIVDIQSNNRKGDIKDAFYIAEYEFLFSEIITNKDLISSIIKEKKWNPDMFERRHFNAKFWEDYNILLETKQEKKLITDLEKKLSLKEQFKNN